MYSMAVAVVLSAGAGERHTSRRSAAEGLEIVQSRWIAVSKPPIKGWALGGGAACDQLQEELQWSRGEGQGYRACTYGCVGAEHSTPYTRVAHTANT